MLVVKLEVDEKTLGDLIQSMNFMREEVMPNTANAMQIAIRNSQNVLRDYIAGFRELKGIGLIKKPINPKNVKFGSRRNGNFDYVVNASGKDLGQLQNGKPESKFDMKTKYPYGKKSRVAANGIPYLIIPFRWGTPNGHDTKRRWNSFIPQAQYDTVVKGMSVSKVYPTTHGEKNFRGEIIQRAEYKWKDRITKQNAWSDNSVGMVRMRDLHGTNYFTFRIISAKSPADKWWRITKAVEGINVEKAWFETVKDDIVRTLEAGVKSDLGL